MSRNAAYNSAALNPLNLFSRLLSTNHLDDLNATMETLRVNLPYLAQLDEERDEEYVSDDEEVEERYRNLINASNNGGNGHYGDTDVDALERLVCYLSFHLLATNLTVAAN